MFMIKKAMSLNPKAANVVIFNIFITISRLLIICRNKKKYPRGFVNRTGQHPACRELSGWLLFGFGESNEGKDCVCLK